MRRVIAAYFIATFSLDYLLLNTTILPQLTNERGMLILSICGVILGIIGAMGGFPTILKWIIYSFYKPDIRIYFPSINNLPPVYSGGVVKASDRIPSVTFGPHIINRSGKTIKAN